MPKSFKALSAEAVEALPGHMGVFELADDDDEVLFIGYAGGRSLFGLRGEVNEVMARTRATQFRVEVTTAYLTRYRELLMRHRAAHGALPAENNERDGGRLGRLSPG